MDKTCKDCEHWEPDEDYPGFGECGVMLYVGDQAGRGYQPKKDIYVVHWDAESYSSLVRTRESFGCNQWVGRIKMGNTVITDEYTSTEVIAGEEEYSVKIY